MISGVMDMYHDGKDTYIENPEDFHQYHIWILRENEDKNTQTSITYNTNA